MIWSCFSLRIGGWNCGIGCICICLLLAGCGGATTTTDTPKTGATAPSEEKSEDSIESDQNLKSILEMLTLDALGFSSPQDSVVGLVNQWQLSLSKERFELEESWDSETLTAFQARLSAENISELRRTAFNKQDIERVRDLLLMSAAVQNAASTGKNDLERATILFRNLVRNSDLITKRSEDLPLSLFNLSLLGKVTVAERAWLFTELLRQLKIDTVILTAVTTTGDSTADDSDWDASKPFLIGVLLNKQVYLFDPLLGLPLTVPGTATKTAAIATLAQTQADEKILRQYDVEAGKPYPISTQMLITPRVLVCGDTCLWSNRFHRLQAGFTGERSAVISDNLLDRNNQPGLISRVTNWPGKPWQPSQIGVWSFPGRQLARLTRLSDEQKNIQSQLLDPLRMPAKSEIVKEKNVEREVRIPTNQFMLARIEHVRGHLNPAVNGYTLSLTRLQNPAFRETPPEKTRIAYNKATEDIRFWVAVCKIDQGTRNDVRIGTDKLIVYLRSYPQGEWSDACHELLANILATNGDFAAAVEEIAKVTPEHPQHPGFIFQQRQWAQAAKGAAAPENSKK